MNNQIFNSTAVMMAVALTVGTAHAAAVTDSTPPAVVSAPDAAPIVVGFSEEINNSLTHTTDQVHSSDRGITAGTIFNVDKFIHNISSYSWTDFHVQLQTLQGGVWANSPDSDGVSYGDIEDISTFLANATVDVNGVLQTGPWTLTRDETNDVLDYTFQGFSVNPGDTLSLHFDMSDNLPDNNTWRLVQTATIPEPGNYGLMLAGLSVIGLLARRRSKT